MNSQGSEIGPLWAKSAMAGLWPIVLNMADFGKRWISLRTPRLLTACKWISNCLQYYSSGFGVNSKGFEIGPFWAKTLVAHGFEHAGNRSKLPETDPICLQMDFVLLAGLFEWIRGELARVRKWPPWARSRGTSTGPGWSKAEVKLTRGKKSFIPSHILQCRCSAMPIV